MAHYNLGIILRDFEKLKDAELSSRKAIELKPDYAEAHYHLNYIKRSWQIKGCRIIYS